jgi:thiol:disulfide interchange protein DsbD
MGLFMFGVFSIGIPSSVTGKAGSGQGFGGAFGMGFLAALLSTPCSFGVLAGVVAWAQTQSLLISTLVFLLMGIGMALPYAVLISMPVMLKKIPRPGDWMERVKQAMGFVLLIIAVKLLESLSNDALIGTLYFAVVLSIAAWMWGSWVSYATPKSKKYTIRLIAVALTIAAGFYFLTSTQSLVEWQAYDSAAIEKAKEAGQPVLIKFDASWCATCKVVDVMVYQKSKIADLLKDKNVLTVKGDTTDYTLPASVDLGNVYNEPGVPVTVIWLPGEKTPIKFRGIISKKDVTDVLERIK